MAHGQPGLGTESALAVAMVTGTIRFHPSETQRPQVLEILRSVQGPVSAEPGCRGFEILEEPAPGAAIVLVERWESSPALMEHLRSDHYRRILVACELSTGPPAIRFEHVTATEGIELIERALTQSVTTHSAKGAAQP
jgi:quinol monooxygenase YgiN